MVKTAGCFCQSRPAGPASRGLPGEARQPAPTTSGTKAAINLAELTALPRSYSSAGSRGEVEERLPERIAQGFTQVPGGLAVQLADAGLGHAQDVADLFEV